MKILITGGAGFIGANLAKYFHARGHDVVVMDNLVRRGSELNLQDFRDHGIQFIHGDIRNAEDLNHLPTKFDVVLETAAQPAACTGYHNPMFDITNNYMGLLNVLEYCRRTNARLIFWSTNKVYNGTDINKFALRECKTRYKHCHEHDGIAEDFSIDGGEHSIYGLSKVCADLTCQEWAHSFDMPIIINRFSCLAGPGQFGKSEQGWVAWFCIAALFHLPVTLYGFKGKQVRDVLFMSDICDLIERQLTRDDLKGEVFNIGGGHKINTSLIECLDAIGELLQKKIEFAYDDHQRKADQCVYISNITKAKRYFGWEPSYSMEEGLVDIIDWVDHHKDKLRGLYVGN